MGVKVIHNGYNIKFLNNMDEVKQYIDGVIEHNKHLNPTIVMDRTFNGNNNTDGTKVRLIRYRYRTLYEEDFILEY